LKRILLTLLLLLRDLDTRRPDVLRMAGNGSRNGG
jgi:hypothetical protein